jgi:hypothetical protein
MPYKDPEKRKQYAKEYQKQYYQKHKQKILKRHKEYQKTPQGIKSNRIHSWKVLGLICDDIDELYNHYIKTTHCDECGVELTYDKTPTPTTKCMDHNHETGEFRNILCQSCNVKRG